MLDVAMLVAIALCTALLVRPKASPDLGGSAGNAYQAFTSTTYFSGLDGLRALSVAGVIWTHVTGSHDLQLLNQGNKGVNLFFAISGFLVTTLLLKERRRTGSISLSNFYMRRTLRIFPLYFAVLALYCVLVFATQRGTPKAAEFWHNLPAFATYTSNWFVSLENGGTQGVTFYFAWSLATEEQFYLFWPPVLAASLLLVGRTWVPAAIALLLALVQLLAANSGGGILSVILASLAPAILFGVAFALILNDPATFRACFPILGHRVAAPATALALVLSLQMGAPTLAIDFLMAVLVATVCVRQDTALHGVLTLKPLAFVGTISYGIYLMHMLAANVVRKIVGHQVGVDIYVGTFALVIVMAFLSYRYFEAPILRMKTRFSRGAMPAAVPPVNATAT